MCLCCLCLPIGTTVYLAYFFAVNFAERRKVRKQQFPTTKQMPYWSVLVINCLKEEGNRKRKEEGIDTGDTRQLVDEARDTGNQGGGHSLDIYWPTKTSPELSTLLSHLYRQITSGSMDTRHWHIFCLLTRVSSLTCVRRQDTLHPWGLCLQRKLSKKYIKDSKVFSHQLND